MLYKAFDELNIPYVKSYTNFVWVETPLTAKEAFEKLMKKGIIIRPFFENWIRITVGTKEQNIKLIDALKGIL